MKRYGKRGMGCIGGVVAVLAAIMLMTQTGEAAAATSINVNIADLGSDGLLAKIMHCLTLVFQMQQA